MTTETTTSKAKTGVERVTGIAEKAVLVQVGAGLTLGDEILASAKDLAAKYQAQERIQRYERRGATARSHLQKQVATHRTHLQEQVATHRTHLQEQVATHRDRVGHVGTRIAGFRGRVEELISNATDAIR